nr:MAG TPA: hypothetical protein [Caudoviricetes sp.]
MEPIRCAHRLRGTRQRTPCTLFFCLFILTFYAEKV